MGHSFIPVTQCLAHSLLLSAPWDDGQVGGNEGFLMAGTVLKESRLPMFHLQFQQEFCSVEPSVLWSMDPIQ